MIRDNYERCKESAFRVLERRSVTEKEMRDKLLKKGYLSEDIIKTIEFLIEYGYLNDQEYAKNYYNSHIQKDGMKKIKFNLSLKGINEALLCEIEQDEEKEYSGAFKLAEKKYNQIIKKETDQYKSRNKIYSYLLSRGYSYDLAKKVVEKILDKQES